MIRQDKIDEFYNSFDNYLIMKEDRIKVVGSLNEDELRYLLLEACNVWSDNSEL